MQIYTIRQIDKDGAVISEKQIEADSANTALRELRKASESMRRIEVYNGNQEQVRQIDGDYWRIKSPRR
jgi:hypothetical protein